MYIGFQLKEKELWFLQKIKQKQQQQQQQETIDSCTYSSIE